MHGNEKRLGRASRLLLTLVLALLGSTFGAAAAQAGDLEITQFLGGTQDEGEVASTTAGARPYEQVTQFTLSRDIGEEGVEGPSENIKDVSVDLPPGIVGNAAAIPTCPQELIDTLPAPCPVASQVGTARIELNFLFANQEQWVPVYNLEPPPGMPAQFGFLVIASISHINFHVRTGTDYGVTATLHNLNETAPVTKSTVRIWGVPGDPGHDAERCSGCIVGFDSGASYPDPPPFPVLLSNPTSCTGDVTTDLGLTTWQNPKETVPASSVFPGMSGCDELQFDPEVDAGPTTTAADSPTGLAFDLHVDQNQDPDGRAAAHLRESRVVLPANLSINPSSANGLAACTPAEIGLVSPVGQQPARFTPGPAECPDAAKIGTVEIESLAVINHPLKGSVYLASQEQNPFGSLLAMYLAVDDPESGVVLKLPGKIEADPVTGQLTTVFPDAPQLPFEDLHLSFFKGASAPLKTGIACGKYEIATDMVPWSSPEGATKHPGDSFEIDQGAGGGACVSSEAQAPNRLRFEAGTVDPVANAYSPFVLKLSREDGTPQVTGIDTTLPKGLVARLAGTPYCPEAALAAAAAKSGREELASPSCPAASQVGSVDVGAGAGPAPFYTQGKAYLAGPYKGAPLSLAVVVPAVAGPLDVGDVVVRNALYVDPESTQVRAVSDRFPTILQGIPLDLRSVVVNLDRSRFTRNPTSCVPSQVTAIATTLPGQSPLLSQRFQVGDCSRLGFKPKLSLSFKGGTKRSDHPAVKAVLKARAGDANIGRAAVTLPKSQFLENAHIRTICTRVQFAADKCPKAAIYGFAKAWSPLLDEPVKGPVYLRSSSHKLPDLVAALDGQIDVDLDGRIDSVNARLRTTFEEIPDVPVTKFVLEMQGGKKGLLVNNRNLCRSTNRADALFDAQNGKTYDSQPVVKVSCKKSKGKGRKRR